MKLAASSYFRAIPFTNRLKYKRVVRRLQRIRHVQQVDLELPAAVLA